jgi:capsular polysaccharide biosynthesis protein
MYEPMHDGKERAVPIDGTQASMNYPGAERYLSLGDVLQIFRRRVWIVISVVLIFVGAAVGASLLQTPVYEATAWLSLGQKQSPDQPPVDMSSIEGLQQLTHTMVVAIKSPPVADEVIQGRGLQMGTQELLDNLTVEQIEDTSFLLLSYRDTDRQRAKDVVNDVSDTSIRRISAANVSTNDTTVTVYKRAAVPGAPVSPKPFRNGLLTLVAGLVLCAGLAKLALPGVGARVAGGLGGRAVRLGIGRAGAPAAAPGVVEGAKEKELLRALGHRGKLTAVEAALETSLSVEEADRILSELAHNGHLKVTVEHGRLLYSFWEHDTP